MHAWIKLACVVLAWTILPVSVASAGRDRPVHPVQVSTRTSNTSFTSAHPAPRPATAALTSFTVAPATKPPATRSYVVRPGDTLSAIATRFGVRGGWPALYAANRSVIGPDPDALNAVLTLHVSVPASYTVAAGDTLSAIAARFGVPGGWPALYTANRSAVGSDPDDLHAGTRLTISSPATAPSSGSAPTGSAPGTAPSGTAPGTAPSRPQPPAQPTSPPVAHPSPSHPQPQASDGVPSWLKTMLLAVGLLAVIVFAAEPLLLARRSRRRRGVAPAPSTHQASQAHVAPAAPIGPGAPMRPAGPAGPAPAPEGRMQPTRIVMADHDRLVITRSKQDDTICVLRRPGEDPADILRVARLVLPEGHYGKLAEQLGLSANWPMNQ